MALGLPTALAVVAASPASAGPSDAGAASASASSTAMPWSSSPPGGLRRLWINGPPPTPSVSITKIPPDPPATRARAKWLFDLKYDRGDPYLLATRKIQLAAPEDAARVMGRFALELYEGPTLIERVRFDFPLLGAPEADAGYGAPPRIEPKLGRLLSGARSRHEAGALGSRHGPPLGAAVAARAAASSAPGGRG
jgi:hypothetical protein